MNTRPCSICLFNGSLVSSSLSRVPPSDFHASAQATGDANEGSTAAPTPTPSPGANFKRTNIFPPPPPPNNVFNNSFVPPSATFSSGADQSGPQTDLVVVAGFLVESLLVHKAAVVSDLLA